MLIKRIVQSIPSFNPLSEFSTPLASFPIIDYIFPSLTGQKEGKMLINNNQYNRVKIKCFKSMGRILKRSFNPHFNENIFYNNYLNFCSIC